MKQIKSTVLILCAGILLLSSCQKKYESPNSTNTSTTTNTKNSSISFKYNGTVKTSTTALADYIKMEQNLQVIGGFGADGFSFSIQNPKVSTFDVVNDSILMTYAISIASENIDNDYIADTGTVTITSMTTTTVAGTFEFHTTNDKGAVITITAGTFNCPLVTQ